MLSQRFPCPFVPVGFYYSFSGLPALVALWFILRRSCSRTWPGMWAFFLSSYGPLRRQCLSIGCNDRLWLQCPFFEAIPRSLASIVLPRFRMRPLIPYLAEEDSPPLASGFELSFYAHCLYIRSIRIQFLFHQQSYDIENSISFYALSSRRILRRKISHRIRDRICYVLIRSHSFDAMALAFMINAKIVGWKGCVSRHATNASCALLCSRTKSNVNPFKNSIFNISRSARSNQITKNWITDNDKQIIESKNCRLTS